MDPRLLERRDSARAKNNGPNASNFSKIPIYSGHFCQWQVKKALKSKQIEL